MECHRNCCYKEHGGRRYCKLFFHDLSICFTQMIKQGACRFCRVTAQIVDIIVIFNDCGRSGKSWRERMWVKSIRFCYPPVNKISTWRKSDPACRPSLCRSAPPPGIGPADPRLASGAGSRFPASFQVRYGRQGSFPRRHALFSASLIFCFASSSARRTFRRTLPTADFGRESRNSTPLGTL
jgi:hypothetical protein